jgi:hypothetical protein
LSSIHLQHCEVWRQFCAKEKLGGKSTIRCITRLLRQSHY